MSADATEPVRSALDALNRRDTQGFTACLHPQVEWEENSAAFPGLAGVYRGTAEVGNWAKQAVEEFWSALHMEVEEVVEVDAGRVLLGISITARGAASGVPTERRAWQAFWIDDGQILKRTGPFWTRDPALAALTE